MINTQNVKSELSPTLDGVESQVSEIDIQANFLSESLMHLTSNIEQLNSKLSPVLKSCPVCNSTKDDLPQPLSGLGNYLYEKTLHVNNLNNVISQILQTLAV